MSTILEITEIIKSSIDFNLTEKSGVIQRTINEGPGNITITFGGNSRVVPPGRHVDIWYDGADWRSADSMSDLTASRINSSVLSTDVNLGDSDALIPSQKAVKEYADIHSSTAAITDVSNMDLDNLTTKGIYEGSNLLNSPDESLDRFYLKVIQSADTGYTVQQASTYSPVNYQSNSMYERERIAGIWTEWRRVLLDCELMAIKTGFWTTRTSAADNGWFRLCYGNGLFVAVANSGTGNRVMTSQDGINWTIRTSAADYTWTSVCYGNGLFVAVSMDGTGNRVMTSPDGINWTIRTSAADNVWFSVCYGNGLFVAVAQSGTGNRVMTSPDGITWTIRTSATDNAWVSVCYGNGLFVTVSSDGTGNRVMTSPDGITWTIRTSAADNSWWSVCYGNGHFVAVAQSGTGNRVMTSPDGINWTLRNSPADNGWVGVCYGSGQFVAVAVTGTGNRVMTSPDGITWTLRTSPVDNNWASVCYGKGIFVAVATIGSGNRVITTLL